MGSTPKRTRANGTRERPQVEVTPHVRAQILASRELVLAHVALERPETGVYAQVHVEIALTAERFRARQARVDLVVGPVARRVDRVLRARHTVDHLIAHLGYLNRLLLLLLMVIHHRRTVVWYRTRSRCTF